MKGYLLISGILAVIILALITLSVFFERTLEMEAAEQFNKQQLIIANQEASNIQDYLNGIRDELHHVALFAQVFAARGEADLKQRTNMLFKDKGYIKKRLEILDSSGRIVFTRGSIQAEGYDERHFFDRARKLCPADSIMEHDTKRVTIVAPICRYDSFKGAAIVTLDIQDIAKAYLGTSSAQDSRSHAYSWMMDEKGNLLYHPGQPAMVGRNLFKTDSSCFKCHKSFDVEKKIIEGRGDYCSGEYCGRYVSTTGEDKILAYSTTAVGHERWVVAVSAPYSEVTLAIKRSMKLYVWLIMLIVMTTLGVSAMLLVLNRKREQAEERAKHEKELERYAAELEQKVTQRTQELSEEKEKLNTIVTAIGSGIVLMDNGGRIQWTNRAMRDMAGRDLTGTACDDLCADCTVVNSYEENEMQTEILANLFGKHDRFYQVTTAPVKAADGKAHAHIRLVQDVTELKKAEEQMMHSEKLASLERLTSGIAGEIGNPLTSVFSFVDVLMDQEEDEFKRETLETIFFHMSRISEILKQLSGFSKISVPELKPCKVNGLIESSLSLIQYDERVQDITIVKDLAIDVPVITTDTNQLSQVIVNIVLNAADAMRNGGTLTIRSRHAPDKVTIDFEDTGVGISKEDLSRIFEPFYTTKEHGSGLSLAVSHSIIRKLNGTLTAESELHKGSRFMITLPVGAASLR